jgi:hypothetical protein
VVKLTNDSQDILGRKLFQHHHQSAIAFGVGQFTECGFCAHDVACGDKATGLLDDCQMIAHAAVFLVRVSDENAKKSLNWWL